LDLFTALWPVFSLLVLGFILVKSGFIDPSFWPSAERFIYFFCFPALLVSRVSEAKVSAQESWLLVLAVVVFLGAGTVLLLILQRFLTFRPTSFTSIYQGVLRFNTFIILGVAASLNPEKGLALAAIIAAVMIPLVNILTVLVFAIFNEVRPSFGKVTKQLATNPLIVSCVLGIALNVTGLEIPSIARPVLELLAQIALPLGLIAVGAAISVNSLRSTGRELSFAVLMRLVVMPLIGIAVALTLDLSFEVTQIFLVFTAVPTASAAYILARQLGGDAPLMANILSVQTLIAFVTLPLALSLAHIVG